MSDYNNRRSQKVSNEHRSKSTGEVTFGYCPWCTAILPYKGKVITECICCEKLVEWSSN